MNKAIMIGAGQIGRGFIGMELEKAGYHVIFADINHKILDDINTRHEYIVHVVDAECTHTVVSNISAISSEDETLPCLFADSEVTLVCTSVGQSALASVAPMIAHGITRRMNAQITAPMNIIAVENALDGTSQLKELVFAMLDKRVVAYSEAFIGFPNSAVDRIIPKSNNLINPADVAVEAFSEWDVEKQALKAAILPVNGLNIVDDLPAYLERKLFTLNGPNAVTACYGYIMGYSTINEALQDKDIRDVVLGMMEECCKMLERRHGFSCEALLAYRTELIKRFTNPYLIDSVVRVAREPIRKLSPNDRIIPAMKHAHEYGIETPNYYSGIAAMLLYDNSDDQQSVELQRQIARLGVDNALQNICGLDANDQSIDLICKEYFRIKNIISKKDGQK